MRGFSTFLLGASAVIIVLYLGKTLDQGSRPR